MEEAPPELIEVERQCVAAADSESEAVHQGIREWLEIHGDELNEEPFQTTNKTKAELPSNDLLGKLLSILGPDDLRRTSMPLDVIAKLRREPLS